jgi:hypothetical protein
LKFTELAIGFGLWETVGMTNKPTLEVTRDTNGLAVSARCSACKKEMPTGLPRGTTIPESDKWFVKAFESHLRYEHRNEDFIHAAVRIVTEATKD